RDRGPPEYTARRARPPAGRPARARRVVRRRARGVSDLTDLTAAEIAAAVRERRVSATEVVRAHLARIESLDPDLHACITVCAEDALATARALERDVWPGSGRALLGVPVGAKDQLWTNGVRTTNGSRLYETFI